jgi:cytidine deaminase
MSKLLSAVRLEILRWNELPEDEQRLLQLALRARENASAPYSHYKVGAAISWKNGRTSVGCNVENCIYNALHAEKCAIGAGIVQNGVSKIEKIAVIGDSENSHPQLPPHGFCEGEFDLLSSRVTFADASFSCGQCLQDILEFSYGEPETVVMLEYTRNGLVLRSSLADVLPGRFGPSDLGIHYGQIVR